jgi:hypothetical protein
MSRTERDAGRAKLGADAGQLMTAPPTDPRSGRASATLDAIKQVTDQLGDSEDSEERATLAMPATIGLTVPSETIDAIRLSYRFAKAAEQSRIRIDQALYAFARVFLSGWNPGAEETSRKKASARAKRVVDLIRGGKEPDEDDAQLYADMTEMTLASQPSWEAFEKARDKRRKIAEKLIVAMPAWDRMPARGHGFGPWGLVAIIGEAGDLSNYSGCRKLFKRLGLAPDECYPTGEKRTGRKIPRNTRGRIMGIIADPLFKKQWDAERGPNGEKLKESEKGTAGNVPAHPAGPYGRVYGEAKARHLAAGRQKGHAEKLARRAMVKALLHDVHAAWHDKPLMYVVDMGGACHGNSGEPGRL